MIQIELSNLCEALISSRTLLVWLVQLCQFTSMTLLWLQYHINIW